MMSGDYISKVSSRIANGSMTVADLIQKLQTLDPNMPIQIKIDGPEDAAWTKSEINVKLDGGVVSIEGWAGSDDVNAFFPGSSTDMGEDDD